MKLILLIAVTLVPLAARADEPRHRFTFTSPNGKFELRHTSGQFARQKWSLIDKATGSARYEITAELAPMTVLVGDDGSSVVAVDDYSEREPAKDLDVLLFYRDGKLVKSHALGELLADTTNVSQSASHFTWLTRGLTLSVSDSKLSLKTHELVHYTFDANTGDVLTKERDPALTDDALYVYGKVKSLGGRRYEMEVCHLAFGSAPQTGRVEFEADRDDSLDTGRYHSVIIRGGKLVSKVDVILNSCNYRR